MGFPVNELRIRFGYAASVSKMERNCTNFPWKYPGGPGHRGGGFFHSKGTWGCAAYKGLLFWTSNLARPKLFLAILVEFSLGKVCFLAILVKEL